MAFNLRKFIKACLPYGFIRWKELSAGRAMMITWTGNYISWEDAVAESQGYDSKCLIDRVKESALKVARGDGLYERDSVLFDEVQYSWPALTGLMRASALLRGNLKVLDYGGGLGSSFFQNRKKMFVLRSYKFKISIQVCIHISHI